ncbi:MAG TPA: murein transglycosylase A [Sphingomonas sp.]|nr:murein transglycosylase A [Sphingomonas sp.]
MRIRGAIALSLLLLGACSVVPPAVERHPAATRPTHPTRPTEPNRLPPPRQPTPTPIAPMPSGGGEGTTAALSGLVAGPAVASLPIDGDEAARALTAFRLSCPSLVRRTDSSGLTRGSDWQPACAAAQSASDGDARAFFARWFEAAQVGDGRAYATGYFIPEVRASRTRRHGYDVPIYGRPADLIDVDLGQFADSLKGKKIRGRVSGTSLVPYYDRTAIEQGAIEKTAPVLAWGADPAEVFFLQIQGSGELRLRDGSIMRVGYDDQNGRDYTGIGKLMLDRGLIGRGEASMQGIVAWLRANPDEGRAIMRENRSFVFFRPLEGSAVGALGLPVTGGVSAAVDPKFVPLGAPVFLSMDRTDATGIWIAQDTGGAIKGANRFDTFWGAGDEAATIAGGMAARGTAFVLLPKGTLARLQSGG